MALPPTQSYDSRQPYIFESVGLPTPASRSDGHSDIGSVRARSSVGASDTHNGVRVEKEDRGHVPSTGRGQAGKATGLHLVRWAGDFNGSTTCPWTETKFGFSEPALLSAVGALRRCRGRLERYRLNDHVHGATPL